MNPHRIVFGPPAEYQAWVERSREALVRSPGEADLFELGLRSRSDIGGEELSLAGRFFALTMGGVNRDGSCARMIVEELEL